MSLQSSEIELLKEAEIKSRKDLQASRLHHTKTTESYEQRISQLETKLAGSAKMNKAFIDSFSELSANLQASQGHSSQQKRWIFIKPC